jgi:hypothetical protein
LAGRAAATEVLAARAQLGCSSDFGAAAAYTAGAAPALRGI